MSASWKNTKIVRILLLAISGIIITATGIWSANILLDREINLEELDATRFPAARQLAPFSLLDHNGDAFNEKTLRNHWSFLFFGYTHCPDVCPTTLSVLNSVAHRLEDTDTNIRFVFISVDPERDTPEKLARFVSYFNENFVGVTGTVPNINEFTSNLGVMHMRVAAEENITGYLVDHTAAIFLMDPDGRYHAVFTPPHTAEAISDDFRKILKAYRQGK